MSNLKEILIKDLEEYDKNNTYDGINVSFNTEYNISKGVDGDFVAHISRDGAYDFDFFITNDTECPITIVCNKCFYDTTIHITPKLYINSSYVMQEMKENIQLSCYKVIKCINKINETAVDKKEKLKNIINFFVEIPNDATFKIDDEYLIKLCAERFGKEINIELLNS